MKKVLVSLFSVLVLIGFVATSVSATPAETKTQEISLQIESINTLLGQAHEVFVLANQNEWNDAFITEFTDLLNQAYEIVLNTDVPLMPLWGGYLASWDSWRELFNTWHMNWEDWINENLPSNNIQLLNTDSDRRNGAGTGWFWQGSTSRWFFYVTWNRHTGWRRIGGEYYFFNPPLFSTGHELGTPRGTMLTGWRFIPGDNHGGSSWMFFLHPDGHMATRWNRLPISQNNNTLDWFYFGSDGFQRRRNDSLTVGIQGGRFSTGRYNIWWSNTDHRDSCMVFDFDGRWLPNFSTQHRRCL